MGKITTKGTDTKEKCEDHTPNEVDREDSQEQEGQDKPCDEINADRLVKLIRRGISGDHTASRNQNRRV